MRSARAAAPAVPLAARPGELGRLARRIVAREVGASAIFTAHGWAFTDGMRDLERRLYAVAERFATPFADPIITVSAFNRRVALLYHAAPSEKVVSVHNGMPDVDGDFGHGPRRTTRGLGWVPGSSSRRITARC